MKLLFLCNSLWMNNLVRTYPFYKKLSEDHEIIVVGPLKEGTEIYAPYRNAMAYRPWSLTPTWHGLKSLFDAVREESKDCDILHVFKPLPWSYFPALLARAARKIPIVLDIEDLDYFPISWKDKFSLPAMSYSMIHSSDAVVVHTRKLQELYGGTIIRTGTDTDLFMPDVRGAAELREKLGLEGKFIIPFLGTPRRYKGIELIMQALKRLNKKDMVFLVVGDSRDSDFMELYPAYKEYIKLVPPQPFEDMPKYLAMSDLVILAHMNYGPWRGYEVPAKIYDSMACAKPVIVSRVGDSPDIIADTGIILKGELKSIHPTESEVKECADAIEYIYDNPEEARRLGGSARKRCVENYSWDVLKKQILNEYEKVLDL